LTVGSRYTSAPVLETLNWAAPVVSDPATPSTNETGPPMTFVARGSNLTPYSAVFKR
jgi:hypothetical protein